MSVNKNDKSPDNDQDTSAKLSEEIASDIDQLKKIEWGESFSFRCHPDVSCWTECCYHANLFVTPYDVYRLKTRLAIDSSAFLEKYTRNVVDPTTGLPVVSILMDKNSGACPFVTKNGCLIYDDRPTSCRVYPLGQAANAGGDKARGEAFYFVVDESQCKGWDEPEKNTLEEWVVSQQIADYSFYNELVMRFGFNPALETQKLDDKKLAMYYMALYDLDRFRSFVFDSSFLEKFDVAEENRKKLQSSDTELLRFAISWLEVALTGASSISLKNPPQGDTNEKTKE